MGRFVSQHARGTSVRRLAERLLAVATANPTLIGRSDPIDVLSDEQSSQTGALRSDPALDARPNLQELGSMPVAATRHAEAQSEQVRPASRKLGRKTMIVDCFGAVGLLIGVTGDVAGTGPDAKLSQIRKEVAVLNDRQRQARGQLGTFASRLSSSVTRAAVAADSAGPGSPVVAPSVPALHFVAGINPIFR